MAGKKEHFLIYGLIMIIVGAIIAFFPGVIVMTFKGILILAGVICAITILAGIFGGDGNDIAGSIVIGAVIVLMYIFSAKIIKFGIGFIGGIAVAVMGIKRLVRAIKGTDDSDIRTINAVLGVILTVAGVICTFNPFSAGWIARILVGGTMIVNGAFNLFVSHEYKKRLNDPVNYNNVIDVNSFTIDK